MSFQIELCNRAVIEQIKIYFKPEIIQQALATLETLNKEAPTILAQLYSQTLGMLQHDASVNILTEIIQNNNLNINFEPLASSCCSAALILFIFILLLPVISKYLRE